MVPPKEMRARKSFSLRLVIMAAAVLFALVVMEAALRLVPGVLGPELQQLVRVNPANYGVAHAYIGHLHKPRHEIVLTGRDFHAVNHTDALGFHNPGAARERADVAVVGDSVSFGYGVADDEAWPALMARSLPQLSVSNLALIGASPQQYLRVYETFGITLRPKLVLVGVFAANDFWDAGVFDSWLASGAGGNYIVWRDFGRPPPVLFDLTAPLATGESLLRSQIYPIARKSYLFNLLKAVVGGSGTNMLEQPTVVRFADGGRMQLMPEHFKRAVVPPSREDHREFQLAATALRRVHALAAENGTHALMVLLPSKEEVYLPADREMPDLTGPLRLAFDRDAIEYLDLVPAFRERAAAGERLFFETDGHPNKSGYALIAKLVLQHIRENTNRYGLTAVN